MLGAAIVYLLRELAAGVSLSFALTLVALLLINLGWGPLLKRKSPIGQQVSDQIAGFRQFLEGVEQDRLNRSSPALGGPHELDRFPPFAIALEVKEAWGDHLAQSFLSPSIFVEE